jgi:flagellar basal body rod protein FlgG
MNVSIAQAAAAMNANARWQESIAENLASSAVPGFKRQELSFGATRGGILPAPGTEGRALLLPNVSTSINFKPGEHHHTGVKTDVSLDGPGFLAVQMPDGSTAYSRDGEMKISSTGELVTKEGRPVLGNSGPIVIDLNNVTELSISAGGDVSQGSDVKGTLRAVEFNDPHLLTPVGQGLYMANHLGLQMEDNVKTSFRQGYVESANTSPAAEMAQLIAAMRIYEANQRVLQSHDDRMGRAISELGMSS